jgi:hypothetical protein
MGQVDVAAEEMLVKRVGPLLHRMAGDRSYRAALLRKRAVIFTSSIVISPSTDSLPPYGYAQNEAHSNPFP